MNDRILYNSSDLNNAITQLNSLKDVLDNVVSGLSRVSTSDDWWGKISVHAGGGNQNARSAIRLMRSEGKKLCDKVVDTQNGIRRTIAAFDAADRQTVRAAENLSQGSAFDWGTQTGGSFVGNASIPQPEITDTNDKVPGWLEAFLKLKGVLGLLVQGIFRERSWDELAGEIFDCLDLVQEAISPTSGDLGLKTAGDLIGANGASSCAASWFGLLLDAGLNWFGNKEEQAESGGAMSEGRVWGETITETIVDAGAVLGIAALASLVGAPGLLAASIAGFTVWLVNVGTEAACEETATEIVSDGLVDTFAYFGNNIGQAVESMGDAIGDWFSGFNYAM